MELSQRRGFATTTAHTYSGEELCAQPQALCSSRDECGVAERNISVHRRSISQADSLPGYLARAITPQRIAVQRLLPEHVEDCRDTAWIKKLAQPSRVIDVGLPEATSCEQPLTTSQSQNIEWRHNHLYTEPTTAVAIWTRGRSSRSIRTDTAHMWIMWAAYCFPGSMTAQGRYDVSHLSDVFLSPALIWVTIGAANLPLRWTPPCKNHSSEVNATVLQAGIC